MFSTTLRLIVRKSGGCLSLDKQNLRKQGSVAVTKLSVREASEPLEYNVDEVKIPSVGGYVAGKLWQGKSANDGSSDIPILCMHGWLDNAGSFDSLLPLIMKSSTTALAIDFPGHGRSSHVSPVHYDAHVECMLAMQSVIQHYGWDKIVILGHSLGAIVGFVFAGVFPEKVHRYIALENVRPIPRDCQKELRYALSKILEIERRAGTGQTPPSYTYDEIVQKFYDGRHGTITIDSCKLLMERGSVQLPNGKYQFAHDIKAAVPTGLWRFSPDQTETIASSITCPVCFIKGEPGGDYESRLNYQKILDLMRTSSERVECHGVSGTHHFHINDPYTVAPIISKFLGS